MAEKAKETSERVIVEKVRKRPKLAQVLKVQDYTLQLTSEEVKNLYISMTQPEHRVYDVIYVKKLLGQIVVITECACAETESEISYVPYDLRINTNRIKSEFEKEIPIELFKKIILATITVS